jgi:hypothetical protein
MATLVEKWDRVINHKKLPAVKDNHRAEVLAQILENQTQIQSTGNLFEAAPTNSVGSYASDGTGVAKYDTVLMAMVRRTMPLLMHYDVCGVQAMQLPSQLIFAMRSRYGAQDSGIEALFNEADTDFSGTGTHAGSNWTSGTDTTGTGLSTSSMEAFGSGTTFNQMSFTIEKIPVEAKGRGLRAEYSTELAEDMKRLHGISAESVLTDMLSEEITQEMNREMIRTLYTVAKPGAQLNTQAAGTFNLDVDSNGRHSAERFQGLLFQLERECNAISQQTRRGRGNFIICSSDIASALSIIGKLDYNPALKADLKIDESSSTFAGMLNGNIKVYIDPYSANQSLTQFAVVGYKGSNAMDAGLFWCPYIGLQKVNAVDPDTFQPKIGFKTRYGIVANPFAEGTTSALGALTANANVYYRKLKITNIS